MKYEIVGKRWFGLNLYPQVKKEYKIHRPMREEPVGENKK